MITDALKDKTKEKVGILLKDEVDGPDVQFDLEGEIAGAEEVKEKIDQLAGLCKLDGLGTVLGQLYILVSWAQSLGLLLSMDIEWPEGWLEWLEWIKLPTFAWSLAFPSTAPGFAFVATLLVHPTLIAIIIYRFLFFKRRTAREGWVRTHIPHEAWSGTRKQALLMWLLPTLVLGAGGALILALTDAPSGLIADAEADGARGSASESGSWGADPLPLVFGDYTLLASALWFVLLGLRVGHKKAVRFFYKSTIENRGENKESAFFGPWAAAEGAVLLFVYISSPQLGRGLHRPRWRGPAIAGQQGAHCRGVLVLRRACGGLAGLRLSK